MSHDYEYPGEELDTFSHAKNWKSYWISLVSPYIKGNVLEVGAGIGTNTLLFNRDICKKWVSIEPDLSLLSRMTKLKDEGLLEGVDIKPLTTSQLPKDELYDTILYIDVLEHIEHDSEELRVASSLLNKEGRIIVLSPAHNFLFSPFDTEIGHFRRYNKKMLREAVPSSLNVEMLKYADSVGLLASLANKLFLKESKPKKSQIYFWDRFLVPASRIIDPIISHALGKTIIAVLKKA